MKPDRERPPLYTVWEEFLGWTLDHTAKIPRSQRFSFGQRIDGHTLDVMELVVQCIYRSDREAGLRRINLKLELLRVLWRIVCKRGWISLRQLDYAQARLDEAGRMSRPKVPEGTSPAPGRRGSPEWERSGHESLEEHEQDKGTGEGGLSSEHAESTEGGGEEGEPRRHEGTKKRGRADRNVYPTLVGCADGALWRVGAGGGGGVRERRKGNHGDTKTRRREDGKTGVPALPWFAMD